MPWNDCRTRANSINLIGEFTITIVALLYIYIYMGPYYSLRSTYGHLLRRTNRTTRSLDQTAVVVLSMISKLSIIRQLLDH